MKSAKKRRKRSKNARADVAGAEKLPGSGQGIVHRQFKVREKTDRNLDLWWHAQISLNLALVLVRIVVVLLNTIFQVLTLAVKLVLKYNVLKILSPALKVP